MAIIWIKPDGNDALDGLSEANAFKTWEKVKDTLSNGDTVKVSASGSGTYQHGINYTNQIHFFDAADHSNVTFEASNPANKPLIIGQPSTAHVVRFAGPVGWTWKNIDIRHYPNANPETGFQSCIHIHWDSDTPLTSERMTVDGCDLSNSRYGVLIQVNRNVTMRNCNSHHHGIFETNPDVASGGKGFGVAMIPDPPNPRPHATGWDDGVIIEDNILSFCGEDGFQPVIGGGSHPTSDYYKYITLRRNTISDNYEDAIDLKGVQYIRIHDNIFERNWDFGIVIHSAGNTDASTFDADIYNNIHRFNGKGFLTMKSGDRPGERFNVHHNLIHNNFVDGKSFVTKGTRMMLIVGPDHKVEHNTMVNNKYPAGRPNVAGLEMNTSTGNIRNNIFYNNGGVGADDRGNIHFETNAALMDTNYIYPTTPSGVVGSNAITSSDPGFVDEANDDYQLLTSSVNRDAGLELGYASDLLGNPMVGAPDLGAYEFQTAVAGDMVRGDESVRRKVAYSFPRRFREMQPLGEDPSPPVEPNVIIIQERY